MEPTVRSLAKHRGQQCLNCKTPLDVVDKYCHQCGQLNTTKRLALKDFFSEFFANLISYDSRVWRTISNLILKPGYVTEQYCAGKRIQYTNPFRFFLTVSIVFFLLLQASIHLDEENDINTTYDTSTSSFKNSFFDIQLDTVVDDEKKLFEAIKKERDSTDKDRNFAQNFILNKILEEAEKDSLEISKITIYKTQDQLNQLGFLKKYAQQIGDYINYQQNNPTHNAPESLEKLEHDNSITNLSRFEKAKRLKNINDDPVKVADILLPRIPLFLFFFAPFMSLFFWLIYARGQWNYMEHMVFNFHLLTLIFIALYVIIAESSLFETTYFSSLFFGIIGPIYFYKALRKFYKQNRFKTILKFLFINFVFLVLLLVSSTLFILGSIFLSI